MTNTTLLFEAFINDFEFPLWHKITYSSLSTIIVILGLLVHQRLWRFFIRRGDERPVDRIIKCQTLTNCVLTPFALLNVNYLCWGFGGLKDWITPQGCYVGTYVLQFFHMYYLQFHSFAIAIFRFGCLVHPEKIQLLGANGPQVISEIKQFKI